ncbi:hypothetical protein E2C01_055467 [Portunus trituberculatus]|uniref:Uncharacterized protein n=1 Tax=Portunus trituberculatus TaxID=210409 RepID=A0A5B7GVK2_PORTR|nr:hypothetical protein [Portunus trituberculatus]
MTPAATACMCWCLTSHGLTLSRRVT